MRTTYLVSGALLSALTLLLLLVWQQPQATWAQTNATPQDDLPMTITLDNGYRITFRGVTHNPDETSTWRYFVEELSSAQDLSNWVLALPDCTSIVTAAPEPWEAVHPDPNAGLTGIKWETGAGFQQGEFTVTLTGHWAVGTTQVAAKGPDVAHGLLAGPVCEPVERPAVLALSKTVTPTIAQAGDVLTYTIRIQNEGTTLAQNVVITDPLPLGTTFVDQSLHVSSGVGEYLTAERIIRWQGDLLSGQVATVTFRVNVQATVGVGSTIINRAYAQDQVATATTTVAETVAPAWVLLVYLAADNNLGIPTAQSLRDLDAFQSLERAAFLNPRLQIYVQWDRSPDHVGEQPDDHTRRYRVRPDLNPFALAAYTEGLDTWNLGEQNMGDPQTLYEFVTWVRGQTSSTYTALSIVGHGGGWSPTLDPALGYIPYLPTGIAWDDSSGDYLSTKELGEALFWATQEHTAPLNVLYLEASMMGMLEIAYEVSDAATYLVASEGAVWARLAYDQYLAGVDETTTPLALAEGIVAGYANALPGYPLTMGAIAIDMTALTPLVTATNDLAVALIASLSTTRPYVAQAYADSQQFDSNWDLVLAPPDAYVDLYDFATQLQQQVPVAETAVHSGVQGVLSAWGQAVVTETHRSGQPWLDPTLTWDYAGAHGLSIYLPLGADSWLRDYYRGSELAWAQDTQWDEFLHNGWYEGQLPPPLPSSVFTSQATLTPIDPAHRPGLFPLQRHLFYLPLLSKE